jgi:tetratricopeptide (TPR) repeat protein
MKLSCRYLCIWIFLIGTLLLSACSDTPTNQFKFDTKTFDEARVNRYFKESSEAEQLALLADLFVHNYDNKEVFENWVRKNLVAKNQVLEYRDVEGLKNLLSALYYANYNELTAVISAKIAYAKSEELRGVKPSAYAVLTYYDDLIQNQDSLSLHLHALGQTLKDDPSRWLRICYLTQRASIAMHQSKFLDALIHFKSALNYTDEADVKNKRLIQLNMALLYLRFDYTEKARISIKAANSYGQDDIPMDLINNMAVCLSKTKNHRAAEELFERALSYARKEKQQLLEAQTLANFGNARRRERRFDEALDLMAQSDVVCVKMGLGIGVVINQLNRAELYNDRGSYKQLASELEVLKPKLFELGEPSYLSDFYRLSYQMYDAIGNTTEANAFYRKYNKQKESYLGDRSISLLSQWELSQAYEQQENEKSQLRLAIQKQENHKLFFGFILVLSLLIMSFVFLFLYRRANKLRTENMQVKQRMTFDLELKSKELLAESLKNISVQQLKEELDEKLSATIALLPKSHHDKFEALQRMLKTAPSKGFLEEFETRFKGVYEDFYIKLRSLAPELTPHEIRICALMRLNISSKEMAILTNRTQGTIDNTRSVIRKKLQLDDHVNLQEYILAI